MIIEKRVLDKKRIFWTIVIVFLLPLLVFAGWNGYGWIVNIVVAEQARQEARLTAIQETLPSVIVTTTRTISPTVSPIVVPESRVVSLTVAFDASASHLPVIQIAEIENEEYSLSLLPLNFNGENEHTAEELAKLLENGEIDILFTDLQFLPRFGNIGKIIFPIDQSRGADLMVSWSEAITQSTTIAVVASNRGHILSIAHMSLAELPMKSGQFHYTTSDDEAVQLFLSHKVEAVAGRMPAIYRAVRAGGTVVASTDDLPVIFDVAIVSYKALDEKSAEIERFVQDWYLSMKMLQENPDILAELLSNWRYNHQPTNGWTRIYRDTAPNDLEKSLKPLAQASMEDALAVMQNPTILSDQLLDIYSLLVWSGATIPELNAKETIEPRFVIDVSDDELLPTAGTLMNDTFQLSPVNLEKERN